MDKDDVLFEVKKVFSSFLYIIAAFLIYISLQFYSSVICEKIGLSSTLTSIIGSVVCILVLYPLFYIPLKKKLIDSGHRKIGKIKKITLIWVVIAGVCGCFVLNGIVVIVQLNKLINSYDSVAQVLYSGNMFLLIIQMVIAAPVVEELLFRGLIYQGLKAPLGNVISAIVSALFFGVVHGNLLQGIYAFILGIILAVIFEKYQSLKPCILFHMSANAFSLIGTRTALLSFIFSSWWAVLFYIIVCSLLLIVALTKIITNKCC